MSRSNYDKPFYVDVGTSIAAVRCQSNRDVLDRFDYRIGRTGIEMAENMCNRMNEEVDKFIAAKEGERKGILKANAQFAADNDRLRGVIAEKDAEIEKLKKENVSLRVLNCGNYYAECNLREEIERLRELVKVLANSHPTPKPCKGCADTCQFYSTCNVIRIRALVANALEVIGGEK